MVAQSVSCAKAQSSLGLKYLCVVSQQTCFNLLCLCSSAVDIESIVSQHIFLSLGEKGPSSESFDQEANSDRQSHHSFTLHTPKGTVQFSP